MTAVHDYHGSCFSSIGRIYRPAVVTGFLNKSLYRRRFGAYNSNYAVRRDHISITYIYKLHGSLFYILDLFTYFLDIGFHVNNEFGDVEILSF